jgi:hypothetical protein
MKPKPIEVVKEMPTNEFEYDDSKLKIALIYDGVAFAEAWYHEVSIQGGVFTDMMPTTMLRTPELVITARFYDDDKLFKGLAQAFHSIKRK